MHIGTLSELSIVVSADKDTIFFVHGANLFHPSSLAVIAGEGIDAFAGVIDHMKLVNGQGFSIMVLLGTIHEVDLLKSFAKGEKATILEAHGAGMGLIGCCTRANAHVPFIDTVITEGVRAPASEGNHIPLLGQIGLTDGAYRGGRHFCVVLFSSILSLHRRSRAISFFIALKQVYVP